ncbi:PDZ domain-containing protein MAGIX isoform X3 [Lagenorhynchus albirostris]|uniref:PDZ domain-containing protein MAGIX isoform X3 n=1 Tax=Lagenorhynchus albirostris TaxID=27610 RepID=UPI0028E53762|nr:PDZ domain-containing protein MAGIX isoform X3 [Lagenorhynchus albirostris]
MEPRAGGATDPKGSRGGRVLPPPAGPRARQLLARLDARPLAARAAADVAALVRRAGATLRLRPKEDNSVLDSADIEVTDSRLPHATFVEHRPQHRRSETLGTRTAPPQVTEGKARRASKPPQASGQFCVELVRSSVGFGFTLSGGRDADGDAPLAVRGLLKDGPAQRCGRLQPGDLVLHINGESTQGLTHAEVMDRIRTGGPRLCLVLSRPPETHPGKPERVGGPWKEDGGFLRGLGSGICERKRVAEWRGWGPGSQCRSWGTRGDEVSKLQHFPTSAPSTPYDAPNPGQPGV